MNLGASVAPELWNAEVEGFFELMFNVRLSQIERPSPPIST
jgi:hypothetical protein